MIKINKLSKQIIMILTLIIILLTIIYLIKLLLKENFTSNKPYKELIFFTMTGCPHCEDMKPTWNLLKKNYNNNQHIKLIEINVQEKPNLVELYKVKAFPTLLYIKDEKINKEYDGDRSYESLIKFLKYSIAN